MRALTLGLSLSSIFLFACDGGGGGDTKVTGDDTGTTAGGPVLEDFINTNVTYAGDTTCFTSPDWLGAPALRAEAGTLVSLEGWVEDFESGDNVPDASIDLYFSDDINGAVDESLTADGEGSFSTSVPVCQPLGYKTYTPADWEETRDTYEVHQIWGYEDDLLLTEPINSVSVSTSRIIPAILGVEWTPGTGIVAGTAYDCNEEPITGAEVVVKDSSGKVMDVNIFYFVDEFPNQSQPETSPDGLWVVVNVPVGTFNVEMYVWDGTQHVLMGMTTLAIKADSVNISNVYTGHDDGLRYPDSCLAQ